MKSAQKIRRFSLFLWYDTILTEKINSAKIDTTNTTENATVKIGINKIFATSEIRLKFSKKNAEIIIKAINVEALIASASATFFGHFIETRTLDIGFVNNTIPNAQAKLIKKLISNRHKGLIA